MTALLLVVGRAWGAAPPDAGEAPPGVVAGPDPAEVVGPPASPAPGPEEAARRTKEAASLLRCVVCQGLSVADSPSETAKAMRLQVERLVGAGYDTDQILTWFEASYGEFVLLEPKSDGVGALVWGGPVALLVVGAGVVAAQVALARRRRRTEVASEDPYLAQVRAETRPSGAP